jgi:hypothetical protein
MARPFARAIVITWCALGLWLVLAVPASASVTVGPCDGSVTILGVTYTPENDTPADPVLIPDESGVVVEYTGNTGGVVIKNHRGSIAVDVGPIPITVAEWSSRNADDEVATTDTYALDEAFAKLPFDIVGIYRVSGKHEGRGGTCEGFAYVKIEGNPLGTVPGITATVVTAAGAAGVLAAASARKPKGTR